MDSLLVILVIIAGILLATGLWRSVLEGLVGGIIKLVITLIVIGAVLVFLYQKFIA